MLANSRNVWNALGLSLAVAACGPRGSRPPQAATPQPVAPAATVAPVQPAGPPPVVIAAQPPAAGDIGTAGMAWVKAVAPAGEWVLLCQARVDTDRDGKVGISYGMHGELYGDELAPYWVRGDGPGEELDELIAVSPGRDHIVVMTGKEMQLVDTRSGARTALRGADGRYVEAGLFDGARAMFDARGEHLLYLRAAATKKARRLIVVRRLADGDEREVDPGVGSLRVVRVTGDRVLAVVHDPAPGSHAAISSHSSGPTHTVGGRRCRADRTDGGRLQLSGTDRRWASLAGGAAVERKEVESTVGADLLLRGEDGALSLERAGVVVPLAPAACKGVVLGHSDGAVLYACESSGDPAELHLWRAGTERELEVAARNPVPAEGYLSDLRRQEHEQRDEVAEQVLIESPDGRVVVHLASGRVRPADTGEGGEALARHGGKQLVRRASGALSIRDAATAAEVKLAGVLPQALASAQEGRLVAAGREEEKDGEPLGMLFDLEAGAVLGTFPGPALAVSTTGWVLSPAPPLAGADPHGHAGPLRWVRPTAP